MSRQLRIVMVGWGALLRHAAQVLAEKVPAAQIVGIAMRNDAAHRNDLPAEVRILSSPGDLAPDFADMVIEGATAEAVEPWGSAALINARVFVPLTISAFVVEGRLERLRDLARRHGSRIVIPSGAIGGIDALRAASFAGLTSVTHEIIKPPAAWQGTPAEASVDLQRLTGRMIIARLSAREAATQYPQNANVAALVALSGIGLDRTMVNLVVDPEAAQNSHIITAEGAAGRFSIRLDNATIPGNPKSSTLTALSLVRIVEAQCSEIGWSA